MAVIGRIVTTPPSGYLQSTYAEALGLIGPVAANGFVTKIGAYLGRDPALAAQSLAMVAYQAEGSDYDPTVLLGGSSAATTNAALTGASGGESLELPITYGDGSLLNGTSFPVSEGDVLWVGTRSAANAIRIGGNPDLSPRQTAEGDAANSTTPSNPFILKLRRTDVPRLATWAIYTPNVKPNLAIALSPSADTIIPVSTPTIFSGTFSDPNSGLGDYLRGYHLQVLRGTTLIWDRAYAATPEERASNAFARSYEGSMLNANDTLTWRVRTYDHFHAWSDWTSWVTVTVQSAGGTTLTTVNGTTDQTAIHQTYTPDLGGVYAHAGGLSANAVQIIAVQRRGSREIIIRGPSPLITKSIAPGAAWSVTWAQTGFVAIDPGMDIRFKSRSRDTAGAIGPYAPSAGFRARFNARPNTPVNLTPRGNRPTGARPDVRFELTDPDDTIATGLFGEVEITRPDLSVVTATTTEYDAATKLWRLSLTTTHVPAGSYGQYLIRARGNDGTIAGPWSKAESFVYIDSPIVTLTAPAQDATIASNQITVTWTSTIPTVPAGLTKTKFRVLVYLRNTTTLAYTSRDVFSATATSHVIPAGYLHDDTDYDVIVEVTASNGIAGQSAVRRFRVDYPTPATLANAVFGEFALDLDGNRASVVQGTWDQPIVTTSDFMRYVVTREEEGRPETRKEVANFTSIIQTRFQDYHPRSGQPYLYRLWWEMIQGTDIRASAVAEFTVTINLSATVINLADDPTRGRVQLPYYDSRSISYSPRVTFVQTWNNPSPTAIAHASGGREIRLATRLIPIPDAPTPKTTLDQLMAIYLDAQREGLGSAPRNETVCLRTPRGDRIFGIIKDLDVTHDNKNDGYGVSLTIEATSYREGKEG